MKKVFFFLPIIFSFSCATLFNSKTQDLYITSAPGIKIVQVDTNTSPLAIDSSTWKVKRKKEYLNITVQNGTKQETVLLESYLSPKFILGNYIFLPGYIVDIFSDKRFCYYPNTYITKDQNGQLTTERLLFRKGAYDRDQKLYLNIHWGFVNQAYLRTVNGYGVERGMFGGIGVGVQYYYKNTRSICLDAGVGEIGSFSLGERFDLSGVSESCNEWNISLLHKHILFNRLECGYGVHYLHSNWRMSDYYSNEDAFLFSLKQEGFGPEGLIGFRCSQGFALNLTYQPVVCEINKKFTSNSYEHLIQFQMEFNLQTWERKKSGSKKAAAAVKE